MFDLRFCPNPCAGEVEVVTELGMLKSRTLAESTGEQA